VWLVADRDLQPISLLSSETIPEYCSQEPDLKRIRRETDHLRRYAVEHFSERSAMTWERAAEMLQKQAQPELALTCAESAIKRIQD
jgi:uncharacterized protein YfaT (DUF1175 family)